MIPIPMATAITIFLSAFLLFTVQLILGKWLLPWFGGAPAVWTTCMLFFQVLLLGGYAYARALDAYLPPRSQAIVHGALLLVAAAILLVQSQAWGMPILPDLTWRPHPESIPWIHLLGTLTIAIALPFFLLAATSPLLQRWYSLVPYRGSPYRLYALSNAGSLLGLLSYPFFFEVLFPVPAQALGWAILFGFFAAGCGMAAMRLRSVTAVSDRVRPPEANRAVATPHEGRPIEWLLLSACAAAMLLSITNVVSQDIAVVPLLWVLPLTIYLFTFILCFDHPRWYDRRFFTILLTILVTTISIVITSEASLGLPEQLLLYGGVLFAFCMLCHGELYRSRPDVSKLTSFYLMVALGGALGGGFVSLAAPLLFDGFWEFPIALLAGLSLFTVRFYREMGSLLHAGHWTQAAAVAGVMLAIVATTYMEANTAESGGSTRLLLLIGSSFLGGFAIVAGSRLLGANALAGHRIWSRALNTCLIFLAVAICIQTIRSTYIDTRSVDRNFYGVVRVIAVPGNENRPAYREMVHGQVQHGFQFVDSEWSRFPTSYYSPDSGAGRTLLHHPNRNQPGNSLEVGVIGLGIGTLAAYGREGDRFVQYEINPHVIALARGEGGWFSYLEHSPAEHEIVGGDARLALEAELQDRGGRSFDVLVLDAFSGDAVPAHLLTTEAFALYWEHLRDADSVIAAHVSNLHLDLPAVVHGIAEHFGWDKFLIQAAGSGPRPFSSDWVVLASPENQWIRQSPIAAEAAPFPTDRTVLWTDRYSSLFRILK